MRCPWVVGLFVCVGCATTLSAQGRMVREADDRMVSRCTFLGNAHGSSAIGGVRAETGRANAVNEVMEQAASVGGTHVVWQSQQASAWSGGEALARVYRCPR